MRRLGMLTSLVLSCMLIAASVASANSVIDGCGQKCQTGGCGLDPDCRTAVSGKCRLDADITCTSGESTIELEDGTDLDLRGFDITCTSGLCNYWVVTMFDAQSKVTSDGSADDGVSVISGPFGSVLNCQSMAGSIVENLTVNDGIIAISGCQTVRNSIIGPTSQDVSGVNYGILTAGVSNADAITENYISGRVYPVFSTSGLSLSVQRNVLSTDDSAVAIVLGSGQTASAGQAKYNIFFGLGTTLFSTPGTDNVSYDGNFCDPQHTDCSTCISGTRCMPYASPFTGN